jgi:hypothetical protein
MSLNNQYSTPMNMHFQGPKTICTVYQKKNYSIWQQASTISSTPAWRSIRTLVYLCICINAEAWQRRKDDWYINTQATPHQHSNRSRQTFITSSNLAVQQRNVALKLFQHTLYVFSSVSTLTCYYCTSCSSNQS